MKAILVLLLVLVGCTAKPAKPGRFRRIQRMGYDSIYEDTKTGDIWMRAVGGSFSADIWTRVEDAPPNGHPPADAGQGKETE